MGDDKNRNERKGRWQGFDLGGGGQGSPGGVRPWRYSPWIYIAAFFAVLLMFQTLTSSRAEKIDYSEFIQKVERGQIVGKVSISPDSVSGEYRAEGGNLPFTSTLPPNMQTQDLVAQLRDAGVDYEGVQPSGWGNLLFSLVPTLLLIGLLYFFLFRRMSGGAGGALNLGRNKVKIYDRKEMKTTFGDVAGLDEATEELREIVDFLKHPKKYQRLGGRIPKGVLLLGPPGCGKTLLARAVAGEANVPFFFMSGSEFVEMFVGLGAARVRELFQQAKEKAPALVFLDEIDTIGKGRGGAMGAGFGAHDEREQTLNQLLVEMDGFDASKGVIIMAATNRPDVLDHALVRPGRFDRQVVVDRPDLKGREAILKVHARGVALDPAVDLRVIAARTPGFTGADLANVVNEAALLAARREKNSVDLAELEEAIDRAVAGLERKSRVMSEKEKQRVAVHEMGHALVGLSCEHIDPLHRVTIIPRGAGALGITMTRPLEDRYLYTEPELKDRLAFMLGGRTAEEVFFGGVISTGAQDDLEKATDLARAMVVEFGMSPKIGPLSFGHDGFRGADRMLFPGQGPEMSGAMAEVVDEEVTRLVNEAHERADAILTQLRELLDRLSQLLMATEVIEGTALREYLDGKKPLPTEAEIQALAISTDGQKEQEAAERESALTPTPPRPDAEGDALGSDD